MKKDSSSFFGIIIIVLGLFFFLNNLGLLNYSMLYPLASWWPVGLIFAGIALIYQRKDIGFFMFAMTLIFFILSGIGNMSMMHFDNFKWSDINCVSASGDVISETRTFTTEFTDIDTSRTVNVYLTQGAQESIKVEAQENLIDLVKTEIINGKLKVYLSSCITNSEPINVYITTDKISSLTATSAGHIKGNNVINGDKIVINSNSAGSVDVEIDVNTAILDASSAGIISVRGTVDSLDIDAGSSGIINAYDLKAKNVKAEASSAGSIQVYALETLDADVSSMGKIQYKGSPTIIRSDISSLGIVQKG